MRNSLLLILAATIGHSSCGRDDMAQGSHVSAVSPDEIRLPDNSNEIADGLPLTREEDRLWGQLDSSRNRTSAAYFTLKTVQYVTKKLNAHYTNSRNGTISFKIHRATSVPSVEGRQNGQIVIRRQGYTSFILGSNRPTSRDGHYACYEAKISAHAGPTDLHFLVYDVKVTTLHNASCSSN
jgi:hypothetical protein